MPQSQPAGNARHFPNSNGRSSERQQSPFLILPSEFFLRFNGAPRRTPPPKNAVDSKCIRAVPVPSPSPPLSASCRVAGEALGQSDLRDVIRDSRIAIELPASWIIKYSPSSEFAFSAAVRAKPRGARELLPLLQGSFGDLQLQRGLTLRGILALTPRSQAPRERLRSKTLLPPRMMRSRPESPGRKYNAIRESRIASSSQLEFCCARRASLFDASDEVRAMQKGKFKLVHLSAESHLVVAAAPGNQRRRERPPSRLKDLARETGAAHGPKRYT